MSGEKGGPSAEEMGLSPEETEVPTDRIDTKEEEGYWDGMLRDNKGNIDRDSLLLYGQKMSTAALTSPEVQAVVREEMAKMYHYGRAEDAVRYAEKTQASPETRQAVAKEILPDVLKRGRLDVAKKLAAELDEGTLQTIVKEAIIYSAEGSGDGRNADNAFDIIEKLGVSADIVNSPEVQKALIDGIVSYLKIGYVGTAARIVKRFKISADVLKENVDVQREARLSLGWNLGDKESELEIARALGVPDDFLSSGEYLKERTKATNRYLDMRNRLSRGQL